MSGGAPPPREPREPREASRRERRSQVLRRLPRLAAGLLLFGSGIALQVEAGLGLSPWDVLHEGLAGRTPLTFGVTAILVGGAVLVLWIPLRQRIGWGTVANVTAVGLIIDAVLWAAPEPSGRWLRWAVFLGGVFIMGVGSGLYIGTRLGPGPRDGLMTGLAARGLTIRLSRFLIETAVLTLGWLLGGTVGWGTVVFAVTIGPLVHFFLDKYDMGEIGAAPRSGEARPA